MTIAEKRQAPFIKIQDVTPESHGINLVVKVASLMYHVVGKCEMYKAGDDTGTIDVKLERSDVIAPGTTIILRNVHTQIIRGRLRLETGKWSTVSVAEAHAGFSINKARDFSAVQYELIE